MTVVIALIGYLLGIVSCLAAAHLFFCWKSGRSLTLWLHLRVH